MGATIGTKLFTMLVLLTLTSCGTSKNDERSPRDSLVPENFAPTDSTRSDENEKREEEEEAAPSEAAGAEPSATPAGEVCSTDKCQEHCGSYTGDTLQSCFEAFKAGCFTSQPEEDYDCQGFGTDEPAAAPSAPPARRELAPAKKKSKPEAEALPEMMGDPAANSDPKKP